jgi:hypothetical protein
MSAKKFHSGEAKAGYIALSGRAHIFGPEDGSQLHFPLPIPFLPQ